MQCDHEVFDELSVRRTKIYNNKYCLRLIIIHVHTCTHNNIIIMPFEARKSNGLTMIVHRLVNEYFFKKVITVATSLNLTMQEHKIKNLIIIMSRLKGIQLP